MLFCKKKRIAPATRHRAHQCSAGGTRVENCVVRNARYLGVSVTGDVADATTVTTLEPITVINTSAHSVAGIPFYVGTDGYNLRVRMENCEGRLSAPGVGGRIVEAWGQTALELRSFTANYEEVTNGASTIMGVYIRDDDVTLSGSGLKFRGLGGNFGAATIIHNAGAGNGANASVEMYDIDYAHVSVSPTTIGSFTGAVKYTHRALWGSLWYTRSTSAQLNIVAAAAASLAAVVQRGDPVISIRFTGSAGDLTVGALPSALTANHGTILNFVNTSNGIVTISGQTPAIPVNGSISFVSTGDTWRRLVPTA